MSRGPIPWREVRQALEGELDGLACRQGGYDSMALGGATPSESVIAWIVEHLADASSVALWFDPDRAGTLAMNRLASLLANLLLFARTSGK